MKRNKRIDNEALKYLLNKHREQLIKFESKLRQSIKCTGDKTDVTRR